MTRAVITKIENILTIVNIEIPSWLCHKLEIYGVFGIFLKKINSLVNSTPNHTKNSIQTTLDGINELLSFGSFVHILKNMFPDADITIMDVITKASIDEIKNTKIGVDLVLTKEIKEFLVENEIYDKWFLNTKREMIFMRSNNYNEDCYLNDIQKSIKQNDISQFLSKSFVWLASPEGYSYWESISKCIATSKVK